MRSAEDGAPAAGGPPDSPKGSSKQNDHAVESIVLRAAAATRIDDGWHEGDVVVHEQGAITVYTNPNGHVVIRQRAWPDDDDVVIVAPVNARALAEAIVAEAAGAVAATAAQEALPTEPAKDVTAAERQRRYRERHRNGSSSQRA